MRLEIKSALKQLEYETPGVGDLIAQQVALFYTQLHDSFLFNNIDNKTIQNILKMYNQYSEKQIFIALDNYLGTDNEDIDEILRTKTRLYLSGDKMLFGKDWRT